MCQILINLIKINFLTSNFDKFNIKIDIGMFEVSSVPYFNKF